MLEISAGAIVYTYIDDKIYYLVCKDFHNNYGFPKGHIEKDETIYQTAIREVKEEVGIDIALDTDFKEELNYRMPNGIDKKSIYFIGYFKNQKPQRQQEEIQEIKLLRYEEALNILTFDSMKQVLIKAHEHIKRLEHEL